MGQIMSLRIGAGVLLAAMVAGSGVMALQVTNRDAGEHTIIITENHVSRELMLKPSEMVDNICSNGCAMQLKGGQEYVYEGPETISIEENLMFLDEPTPTPATQPKP